MNNTILEELNRIKLLTSYDTTKTLRENIQSVEISEVKIPIPAMSKAIGGADDVTRAISNIWKNFDLPKFKSTYKINLPDELIIRYLGQSPDEFAKSMKKAIVDDYKAGYNKPNMPMGPNLQALSKLDALRKINEEVSSLAKLTPPKTITKKRILQIFEETKLKNQNYQTAMLKFAKKKIKAKKSKEKLKKQEAENAQLIADQNPGKKGLPWKKLLGWGLGIGIPVMVLWGVYELLNDESPQYSDCSGTYTMFCKSSVIKKVQGCLNITTDGFWGPETQRKLEELFPQFSTTFTDADVATICKEGGSSEGGSGDQTTIIPPPQETQLPVPPKPEDFGVIEPDKLDISQQGGAETGFVELDNI